MTSIEMVDLKRQYLQIQDEVDKSIKNNLLNAAFINGEDNKMFAQELAQYLNVKHVIPNANGTEALQIALMALGLQPGDEVITPSYTYIATVEVIALLKLKPVFVDVDKDTFNIDPQQLEKAISSKTKAIIPVHLYGQPVNILPIIEIAKKYKIPVIEDTAQAIGSTIINQNGEAQKVGTIGTIGCTSFFPSKNLGCYGDGGAIFTNDDALASKIKMIANHGQKERYYHEMIGCNSRLDNIQAGILRIKLRHLDEYIAKRTAAADYYDKQFQNNPFIKTPARASYGKHVFHQYTITLQKGIDRDLLKKELANLGIPSMIYYPVPCHQQKALIDYCGEQQYDLPITEWFTDKVLSLPMHTELDMEQLAYITQHVNALTEKLATALVY